MYEQVDFPKEIRCPECARKGYRPTLLCRTSHCEGTLYLWCRSCRKEIVVHIKGEKVEFEP